MAALLALQRPFWSPGERLAYHGLTFGWLSGELIRRIDGRSVGHFFADEVAEPLGLELWIGLPSELEPRVSTLIDGRPPLTDPSFSEAARAEDPVLDAIVAGRPGVFRRDPGPWNSTAFRCSEIPAVNAIGTARSIARLYGCLARDGELDGVRLLSPTAVALGRRCLVRGVDAFNGVEFAYGVGFLLQSEPFDQGPPASAFGHPGAGGSVHGAWPSYKTGFSYAMNDMREDFSRAAPLLRALHEPLASDVDAGR
jgi:CubicO group peptidase (beta-lactamase class C family)